MARAGWGRGRRANRLRSMPNSIAGRRRLQLLMPGFDHSFSLRLIPSAPHFFFERLPPDGQLSPSGAPHGIFDFFASSFSRLYHPASPFPLRLSRGSVQGRGYFVPHLLLSVLPLWGSPHTTAAEMERVSWACGAGREGIFLRSSIITSALNSAHGIDWHCSLTAFFRHTAHPLAD
jgi:hypothetical protein